MDEISAKLESTAKEKACAMQDFAITCYRDILRPVQVARAHLAAQPHITDITAVAGLVGAP